MFHVEHIKQNKIGSSLAKSVKKSSKKFPVNRVGRPAKVIDWEIVKNLCVQHHTMHEIAAILGIDINTLKARCLADNNINFSIFYKQHLSVGKSSIRKKLWEEAMNGNTQVLMHQAKHVLQQWDKQQVEVNIRPYVIESHEGKEVIKLGVEQVQEIEGETIDVETIDASEKTYYDVEKLEDNIDELTENQSDID